MVRPFVISATFPMTPNNTLHVMKAHGCGEGGRSYIAERSILLD